MVCRNLTNIYVLELVENSIEHTFKVDLNEMEKSPFAAVMAQESENGLLNTLGCQIRLHTYSNGCFTVEYFVFDDRKIILDCYRYREEQKPSSSKYSTYDKHQSHSQHYWTLLMIEIDIEINGNYVVESINQHTGQIAIYKQA